jgi:hypothetical protein
LKPGERLTLEFRAYNGVSYLENAASVNVVVNRPPSITLNTADPSPIAVEAGKPLVLPFSIWDEDGDALTVLYRMDDDVTWSIVPVSSEPNVIPANLVSRVLSTPGVHTLEVAGFDGLELSETPISFELFSAVP